MLTFDGERQYPIAAAPLWAKLRDATFLVQCIPDGTVKGTPELDKAQCNVRPGLSFLTGTLDVDIAILEAVPPSLVKIQLASKGLAASSDVLVTLNIADRQGGSAIQYQAEVTRLGGLLRALPSGLIRGAAQKIIEQVWENVGKKLTS
jgi:carbon monoxide dehydrogenase subunit G